MKYKNKYIILVLILILFLSSCNSNTLNSNNDPVNSGDDHTRSKHKLENTPNSEMNEGRNKNNQRESQRSNNRDNGDFDKDKVIIDPSEILSNPSNDAVETGTVPGIEYPLYFSTMTHYEGGTYYNESENMFMKAAETLREVIDLAITYDAKITIESEKPFAIANNIFNDNVLLELLNQGQGVGTHCDLGIPFEEDIIPFEDLVDQYLENKQLVDHLVGEENNLGCSGGGGYMDWILALNESGFSYSNGAVAMVYLGMDKSVWPDSSWDDKYIRTQVSHEEVPFDLMDRIYLRLLKDGQDFDYDADGSVVFSSGGLGRLDAQYNSLSDGVFEYSDVDSLVNTLIEVNINRDPFKVAKIDVHLSVEHFKDSNRDVLEYFFSEMESLQNQGVIQWATQAEVYQIYIDSLS